MWKDAYRFQSGQAGGRTGTQVGDAHLPVGRMGQQGRAVLQLPAVVQKVREVRSQPQVDAAAQRDRLCPSRAITQPENRVSGVSPGRAIAIVRFFSLANLRRIELQEGAHHAVGLRKRFAVHGIVHVRPSRPWRAPITCTLTLGSRPR